MTAGEHSRVRAVRLDDLDWVVEVLRQRRELLVPFAPVFWRPAPGAPEAHRAFIGDLLGDAGTMAFRTDASVLVAVARGDGWLVDDAQVSGPDWATGDGRALWNALDDEAHGAEVRFVCPTYEEDRAEFARAVRLSITESWWLMELPGISGGRAGVPVGLPGADAITVSAPPVYDPLGPVLFLPALSDARAALPAAVASAPRLGCPAIVVNHVAGDAALALALWEAGFRRHCDYYGGVVASL